MHWIDWLVVLLPLGLIAYICIKTKRHVQSVADFLAGGRVAGRYVLAVAGGEGALGLISIVALYESYYKSGFAYGWWAGFTGIFALLVTMTGFIIYRYRETRAMTMAQFFEVRYSKRFRLFAGVLAWVTGVFNYGIFPAVGARFLVYYCDLPPILPVLGFEIPTFAVCMALFLTAAYVLVVLGGQITVMVSDALLGLFSYPMYVAIFLAVFWYFDKEEFFAAFATRPDGQSYINPFDTADLQDFNVFYVLVAVFASVYNRLSWQGTQGYNAAAINAHEQKMAGVLGTWRTGFYVMAILFTAWGVFTLMNHAGHTETAAAVNQELAVKTLLVDHRDGLDPRMIEQLSETPSAELVAEAKTGLEGKSKQTFDTITNQMLTPVAIRHILPVGVVGAFCAVMVFLLISTDTTYLHSWGSIFVQDVVVPLRKTPLDPKTHLLLLRLSILFVAVYAFFFSLLFSQVTYILMFFALTGALYMGGAGSVIIGGLYWKRGTTAGAWTAMLSGLALAITGFLGQNFWVDRIYPWIAQYPTWVEHLDKWLQGTSAYLPWVHWEMKAERFPINGQEIYFLTMVVAVVGYIGMSLLTCREPFNLERMLHRGKYRRETGRAGGKPMPVGEVVGNGEDSAAPPIKRARSLRELLRVLSGIDAQYSRGDKILAYSVIIYSLGLGLGVWILQLLWNLWSPWSDRFWFEWTWYYNLTVTLAIGLVTMVWFGIGTTIDLQRLFKRLEALERDERDDGRVLGHVNADDVEMVETVEHHEIPEAHQQEKNQ